MNAFYEKAMENQAILISQIVVVNDNFCFLFCKPGL